MRASRALLLLVGAAFVLVSPGDLTPAQESVPDSGLSIDSIPPPSPAVTRRLSSLLTRMRQPQTPMEREAILDQLISAGPEAIPLLAAELESKNRRTWPLAIYALGAIGDERAIPLLREQAERQSGHAYMDILYALALAGDPRALPEALRSTHATITFSQGTTAVDYIAGALGPDAVPVLIREIPRRAEKARVAALGALGTIADSSAVAFLLEWSTRPEALDRRFALMALARIGDPRARERMRSALRDEDPQVRQAAFEGAGYLRDEDAVPALIQALQQPVPLRRGVIWSLGLIGGEQAASALAKFLARAEPSEQRIVLEAMGRTRHPAATTALRQAALQPDQVLGPIAVRSLAEIEGDAAQDALLQACTEGSSHAARMEAALKLVDRRDPRAVPCVSQIVRGEIERHRGLSPESGELLKQIPLFATPGASESLTRLVEEVSAPAIQFRLRAAAHGIRLVHELGTEVDPWIELLNQGTSEEVDLAILRLGELRDPSAVEPLCRLFGRIEPERAHSIPRALGEIGSDRATPFLISLLIEDIYRVPSLDRVRSEAARALARFAKGAHVAHELEAAYLAERGRLFAPLLAYARLRGPDGIARVVEFKRLLLRRRGEYQVVRHEKVNWAIRMLRAGHEIPWEEVLDPF
ncbi:MAG: HEAT repeat domain-containing protein [Acidobacteriota bacterium]|nr:MAG: HEAT repeat domain-containing protein [Acidobacteriota bacterium]